MSNPKIRKNLKRHCEDSSILKFYKKETMTDESSKRWICFMCHSNIPNDETIINLHVDKCLVNESKNNLEIKSNLQLNKTDIFFTVNDIADISRYKVLKHDIPGLFLIHDFISIEEEENLLFNIENDHRNDWKFSSFNGHCLSKQYGVRTQFGLMNEQRLVRENDVKNNEFDIPEFMYFLVKRLHRILPTLETPLTDNMKNFIPNECNVNLYEKSKKDYLVPHFDDRYLSGEVLMNISLAGYSKMTFVDTKNNYIEYDVSLPRRCLQLVTGLARYTFLHSIKAENIIDERRISITFRKAGDSKNGVVSDFCKKNLFSFYDLIKS